MSDKPDFEKIGASVLGGELTLKECEILGGAMGVHKLKDGETLVDESGTEHTLFVLIDGQLKVISVTEGKPKHVYTMKAGEVAGTRAFVDRTPRKATLEAVGDTVVYTLEPDAFEAMLDSHPRIVYKVMRSIFRITHSNLLRMNQETEQLSNYINKTHGRY
jgi:CRP/FNR family cyclic AMP-dependent transcriptional regulator